MLFSAPLSPSLFDFPITSFFQKILFGMVLTQEFASLKKSEMNQKHSLYINLIQFTRQNMWNEAGSPGQPSFQSSHSVNDGLSRIFFFVQSLAIKLIFTRGKLTPYRFEARYLTQ